MQQWKNMVIFDTNMILRYILNDNEEMADHAEAYITAGNVFVTPEVVAEAVYVLKGAYALNRATIADTMINFLELVECNEIEVLRLALVAYATHNLDFVDCILYAYHQVKGVDVATFDKKLLRLLRETGKDA